MFEIAGGRVVFIFPLGEKAGCRARTAYVS